MLEEAAALEVACELIEAENFGIVGAPEEIRHRLIAGWAVFNQSQAIRCPIERIGNGFCNWSDFDPSGVTIDAWLRLHLT
ncbi:hypothetical protein ACFPM2_25385 [Azospirillum picis]|nr:hypothetical protein [Azospirillum picis]